MNLKNVLLVSTMLLSGCYAVHVRDTDLMMRPPAFEQSQYTWSFVYGLIPAGSVDTGYCEHGVRKLKTRMDIMGVLVNYFTVGLVTPMKTTYQCATAPAE